MLKKINKNRKYHWASGFCDLWTVERRQGGCKYTWDLACVWIDKFPVLHRQDSASSLIRGTWVGSFPAWLRAVSSVARTELTPSSQDSNGMQSALKQMEHRVPADPCRRHTPLRQSENVSLWKLDTQLPTQKHMDKWLRYSMSRDVYI